MEQPDHQQPFANGVECAVCGRMVPADGIRVLAQRDDLVFVELACASCRSESLGIIVEGDPPQARGYGEFLAADEARFHEALPIGPDDVLVVRDLLARGDLEALVGGRDRPSGGAPG
jgi:hypothetical protein